MKFLNNSADTLYDALMRQDLNATRSFLTKGEVIPEFLYLQVTHHDNPSILQFLLEFQPEKRPFAIKLAVRQGAINCLCSLIKDESAEYLKGLTTIKPRKNIETMTKSLNDLIDKKNNSGSNVNRPHDSMK